ncbi:hypothetical protein [Dyella sp. Tek66A03]|uniref:hypothetical protein n=1 Tax=Dyella sp. Tek66A03 TaxID=3458298 RepID=UPI00403EC398
MTVSTHTRDTAPPDWLNYREWATVSTESWAELPKLKFSSLCEAIIDYIEGRSFDESRHKDGIYRQTLLRAFNRCISPDGSGDLLGWRGLIPRLRIRPPERHKPLIASGRNKRGGLSGALMLFLRHRRDIAGDFESYLLKSAKRAEGHEARLREKSAHQKFIELCENGGVTSGEWPFCTRKRGRESIRRFLHNFLRVRYDDIVATQFGSRAKARSHTGTGHDSRLMACRPFDIVEMDEHKCGFIGSIGIPTPEGMRWFPVERVTIILVVERWLRVILGYKVIFRREANADDVLDALNSAMGNGEPRTFCEGFEAQSGIGLPGELGGPFAWCGWNQLLVDNALIHLATEVSERARGLVGCDLNFGPIRRFERRATVENVFGGLERLGFRRLPSTVGTSTQDPMRQAAEKAAEQMQLTAQQVVDLVESVIRDHNGRVSKSNFGSKPIARLEAAWRDVDGTGVIFPVLPRLAPGVASLDVSILPLTIRGDERSGRRPYFTFEGESYTAISVAKDFRWVETPVFGHVKRSAIREILIFTQNGAFVDKAKVMGRWAQSEHSRDIRKHINALVETGRLEVGYMEDPVHRFLETLKQSIASRATPSTFRKDIRIAAEEQTTRQRTVSTAPAIDDSPPCDGEADSRQIDRAKRGGAQIPDGHSIPDEAEEDDLLDYEGLTAFEEAIR